ncbi:PKD domain-containing protein [Saccharothrix australiensis]|uniref:PKD domain-containing protein n=1 Tax=Saccharothrix australiensis TaxID=2072 RepID=A0A495W1W8_9PSEU|nr:PKD domain-containing protein [Saccharothrix australiensis]RKT55469.1 PKD domain-containing protein [Saccharothrix australiensis]
MTGSSRSRALIVAFAALTAMSTPGIAHAEPPSNDDFDHSTEVGALPFTARQDTAEATKATDDPTGCDPYEHGGSIWFRYTATEDGLLRATTAADDQGTLVSAFTGSRGDLHWVENGCGSGRNAKATIRATAGTTYHFLVAGERTTGGSLSFALDRIAPAANDRFADAEPVTALPATRQPDLSTASFEADEPESRCVQDESVPSVWYSYTAAGQATSVTARVDTYEGAVTVYTGDSLPGLTEITCEANQHSDPTVFAARPGTTYHLRVTGPQRAYQPLTLFLAEAPPLAPGLSTSTHEPTVYETVTFETTSWQAIDRPLTAEWDFGDGTTAPATVGRVAHRYTRDGVYPITARVTSPDGRTATVRSNITVSTHDVAIERFAVPTAAREGQSKPITVHVANTRYTEKTTVTLYKNSGNESWRPVGSLTLDVPAHPTRRVQFPFSYTFTPDDAVAGKVAFRAVAELPYPVRDARSADNEVVAIATTVKPRTTAMKAA